MGGFKLLLPFKCHPKSRVCISREREVREGERERENFFGVKVIGIGKEMRGHCIK